jgi:hypothetical protein
MIVKGKTTSGFEFKVDDRLLQDFRFIRAYREWMKNNFAQVDVLDCMLKPEDVQRLLDHISDKDGFVDSEKVASEMSDIFEFLQEHSTKVKN